MTENEISYKIRGIVFEIHKNIGPGLLESVYEQIMFEEIIEKGMEVKRQVPIPLIWKNKKLERVFRADLIVENKVIIELKSVENDINKGITRYINGKL